MALFDDRAVRVREVRPQVQAPSLFGQGNGGWLNDPLVPQDGTQLVAAGAAFDYELKGERRLVGIDLDIPTDVSFDLEINGTVKVSGRDLGGCIGRLSLGNEDGTRYTTVQSVRLTGVNASSLAQDIRAWLVGIP